MRVLVADDSPEIQRLWADMLKSLGHEAVVASDGAEAYDLWRKAEDGHFDVVLTDYQMPRKNGVALMMDIRAKNDKQRMVLASADPPTSQLKTYGLSDVPVLTKGSIRLADLEAALAK